MSNLTWYIQNNLGERATGIIELHNALNKFKIRYEPLRVIPFSDEPPNVDNATPAIFYGSSTLTKNVARSGKWKPGVFFTEENYKFPKLLANYGSNLLNYNSAVVTARSLLDGDAESYKDVDKLFFVRPAGDLKEFTGCVMSSSELIEWANRLKESNGDLTLDTLIQISEPKNIFQEYRTIIVDGKVVASSLYCEEGRKTVNPYTPTGVIGFAEAMAGLYQPDPVFVLDICVLPDGRLKIIEPGCFNGCGFYAADVENIVFKVSKYINQSY